MEYRNLGRTGLKVSSICLGAMTFGEAEGFMKGSACDEETSRRIMDRAYDAGCNFIDTADIYGHGLSEEIVGRWVRDRRDRIVVATKVRLPFGDGPNDSGLSRAHILDGVHGSLKRLGTDYIDLMQVHMQDSNTPIDETLRAFEDLVRQGKIRYIGCSNYTAARLVESLWVADKLGTPRYDCLQPQYSLLVRNIEREALPACVQHGVGVIAWSPLAAGFLTGKAKRGEPPAEGTRLDGWKDFFKKHNHDRAFDVVDAVCAVAEETSATPAQVALRWVLDQEGVTSVIIGARNLSQFEDNLGADSLKLSDAQLARLSKVSRLEGGLGYPYDFIRAVNGRL